MCKVEDAGLLGAPGVAVSGEVDIATVPVLEAALDAAIRHSEGAFVLDLSDVDFIDSSGLHVLLRARSLLGRADRALAVICGAGRVRRLFELSGIADLFLIYSSREEAAAALVPADRPTGSRPAQADRLGVSEGLSASRDAG
jgi:anti-sigma B factor antagonist